MNRLFINFICTLIFLGHVGYLQGAVSAETNRKTMSMGESIQLTLQINDDKINSQPDLEPLKEHFDVLNTSEQTQFKIFNGQASSSHQWIISLTPKNIGTVTIPAIKIGDLLTESIQIEVIAATEVNAEGQLKDVFINTSIEPENPYVSSQAFYTVQVYYNTDIQSGQLTEPVADGSLIKQIGSDANYQKTINGRVYRVLERRYAIAADKSGPLTISAPVLSGYMRKNDPQGRSGMLHWMSAMLEPVRVSANPTQIEVKPIPDGITFADWLPAKTLTVQEEWSADSAQLIIGQPITRTITIAATGISADKLPDIKLAESPGVLIYPDKPLVETSTDDKNLLGKRIEKLAIIPTQIGQIHLPAIEIKWWNIDENRSETATVPARSIQVVAAANSATDLANLAQTTAEITQSDELIASPTITGSALTNHERYIWVGALLSLLLGWLLTLIFWKRVPKLSSEKTLTGNLSSNFNSTSINEIKKAFKGAALNNQILESKQLLITWAKLLWPNENIRTLGQIEKLINNDETQALVRELDKCIYTNQSSNWDGQRLWLKLENEMIVRKEMNSQKASIMPGLYLKGE